MRSALRKQAESGVAADDQSMRDKAAILLSGLAATCLVSMPGKPIRAQHSGEGRPATPAQCKERIGGTGPWPHQPNWAQRRWAAGKSLTRRPCRTGGVRLRSVSHTRPSQQLRPVLPPDHRCP